MVEMTNTTASDDDVWDSMAESEPGELPKVEREHGNAGYLAGITKMKETTLQEGFDEGYGEGAEVGLAAGRIIGRFQALGLEDLEKTALKELAPQRLFSSQYYDQEARPLFGSADNHPLIKKWQITLNGFLDV